MHLFASILRQQPGSTSVFVGILGVLCAVVGGCGWDHAENRGTDNAYIRAPEDRPAANPMREGQLLPIKTNDRWTYNVVTERVRVTDGQAASEAVSNETEEVVVTGNREMGGKTVTVFETRKRGKKFREELFAVADDGLYLVAAGLNDKVTMAPPIPLVHLPVNAGEGQMWNGVLKAEKGSAPGACYSRVSGYDEITTRAGKLSAWRVDTMIKTTIQGQPVSYPITRWFAPGVGMVRQKLYTGDVIVEKLLDHYQLN